MNVCVLTSLEPTNPLIAQCVSQCERLGGEVYVLINELPFRTDNDTLYISFLGDVIIPESLIVNTCTIHILVLRGIEVGAVD